MKLYFVMSDTHGSVSTAKKTVENYPQINGIIHLGDYYKDGRMIHLQFPAIECHMVPGNCDFALDIPTEKVLEVEGKKLLLTHGNRYDVKSGLERIQAVALKGRYDAILFGHTHVPLVKNFSNILFLNPGSLGYSRGISGSTFALLEIGMGRIEARILDAD